MKRNKRQHPVLFADLGQIAASPGEIARNFDPTRLTQARHLTGFTKREVADAIGVTPAAVGQYEAGMRPRPELINALAETLDVPPAFFLIGRPHARLDASMAHFRSLRSTRAAQRAKAAAYVEQLWELTYSLEKRVQLPLVDLPGFSGGESLPSSEIPVHPPAAARMLRASWHLGEGPVRHLIRTMEAHGIVTALVPFDEPDVARVDAFSTSRLPRPIVLLTPDRAKDVYRHRFTAAHELGHLILHGDIAPGDYQQEREADSFAAEFLTPAVSVRRHLSTRINFATLMDVQRTWGVSVKSLIYRHRELGLISESAASRAYQRLHVLQGNNVIQNEPATNFPGELPVLLSKAFDLVSKEGFGLNDLARELAWSPERVRTLLSQPDQRPTLQILTWDEPSDLKRKDSSIEDVEPWAL